MNGAGGTQFFPQRASKASELCRIAKDTIGKSVKRENQDRPVMFDRIPYETSDILLPPDDYQHSEWERGSVALTVDMTDKEMFRDFKRYFESEMNRVNDGTLSKEVEVLDRLINF